MANNAELTKDILTLAPETVVEGKTNKKLVEILKGLRANATPPTPEEIVAAEEKAEADRVAAEEKAEADRVAAEEKAEADRVAAAKLPPYTIAKGKAVTCKKGMLKEGDEIKSEYVGDKESFNNLIKKGFVVKN